jgi:hypothetical protein
MRSRNGRNTARGAHAFAIVALDAHGGLHVEAIDIPSIGEPGSGRKELKVRQRRSLPVTRANKHRFLGRERAGQWTRSGRASGRRQRHERRTASTGPGTRKPPSGGKEAKAR